MFAGVGPSQPNSMLVISTNVIRISCLRKRGQGVKGNRELKKRERRERERE